MKQGFIYIMANNKPTLYTGVTSDLKKRVYQHKNNLVAGFTSKYNLHKLVYYEVLDNIEQAIIREKQIKDMDRKDKIEMISSLNPEFNDLYDVILGRSGTTTPESILDKRFDALSSPPNGPE